MSRSPVAPVRRKREAQAKPLPRQTSALPPSMQCAGVCSVVYGRRTWATAATLAAVFALPVVGLPEGAAVMRDGVMVARLERMRDVGAPSYVAWVTDARALGEVADIDREMARRAGK